MQQVVDDLKTVRRELETGVSGRQPLLDRARAWTRGLNGRGAIWVGLGGFVLGVLLMSAFGGRRFNPAPLFIFLAVGLVIYRKFRHRRLDAIAKFARRSSKLPEIRLVTSQGDRIVVIVDRPTAKTYVKLNALLAQANKHILHGQPLTLAIRESVSDDERRTMLTSAGLQYARDDA
jgi:hypothetical protein